MANGLFTLKQQVYATEVGAWPNQKTPAVDYLVVAGGGGGGGGYGTGGGAGGMLSGNIPVVTNSAITVTIGAGGAGNANNVGNVGANSSFGNILANGGGFGTSGWGTRAGSGGSGGGSGGNTGSRWWGEAVAGQGNRGGGATSGTGPGQAGGGGAGTAGGDGFSEAQAGSGGNGLGTYIGGPLAVYAGGGGGGIYNNTTANNNGLGGTGGGGNGGAPGSNNGSPGTANTGGGGGGASVQPGNTTTGGAGGSGIVIISYPDAYAAPTATTGSPTVSTSGTGSVSFNGTTQALIYPASANYAFGAGDFTVEMYVYRSNSGGILLDSRPGAIAATWAMYCNTTKLGWYTGPLDVVTPSDIPLNTWAHIAACRSGTTTRLFINGNLETSFTDITNYVNSSPMAIGRNAGGGNYFSGNMSNIRINKGVALYTSSFTPPAAPLPRIASTGFLLSTVSGAAYADSSASLTITTAESSPPWSQLSPFATGLGFKNRVYTWTSSGSITF